MWSPECFSKCFSCYRPQVHIQSGICLDRSQLFAPTLQSIYIQFILVKLAADKLKQQTRRELFQVCASTCQEGFRKLCTISYSLWPTTKSNHIHSFKEFLLYSYRPLKSRLGINHTIPHDTHKGGVRFSGLCNSTCHGRQHRSSPDRKTVVNTTSFFIFY